eukprot:GHVO01066429.1.p2 GENE.GHVO01066429.1~~GHVO01066429.1.p2  ORF type:complete len:118 (+),score=26.44 GHVO01066429.1:91-444(+)
MDIWDRDGYLGQGWVFGTEMDIWDRDGYLGQNTNYVQVIISSVDRCTHPSSTGPLSCIIHVYMSGNIQVYMSRIIQVYMSGIIQAVSHEGHVLSFLRLPYVDRDVSTYGIYVNTCMV